MLFPQARDTETCTLADVGSGAGFPGIPIKLWAPHIELTLIESQNKKATFLREVLRTLKLDNAHVFGGRAEDWGNTRGRGDSSRGREIRNCIAGCGAISNTERQAVFADRFESIEDSSKASRRIVDVG